MSAGPLNVYICGSGHSGSTLLDMLLGGHSHISALGEVGTLQFNLKYDKTADRCACGHFIRECDYWSSIDDWLRNDSASRVNGLQDLMLAEPEQVIRRYSDGQFHSRLPGEKRLNPGIGRSLALLFNSRSVLELAAILEAKSALWRRIYVDRNLLYEAVRRATGTPIVVDSTKNPGYLKGIWWYRTVSMRFIEIIRDGRAICAARMRREGRTMSESADIWRSEFQKRRLAMRGIPHDHIFRIRYEDLAQEPRNSLAQICAFLNVTMEPLAMLDFRKSRHNVGGNPMRYKERSSVIQLDTRWRNELSTKDLKIFERRAGWLNRRLGYQ